MAAMPKLMSRSARWRSNGWLRVNVLVTSRLDLSLSLSLSLVLGSSCLELRVRACFGPGGRGGAIRGSSCTGVAFFSSTLFSFERRPSAVCAIRGDTDMSPNIMSCATLTSSNTHRLGIQSQWQAAPTYLRKKSDVCQGKS